MAEKKTKRDQDVEVSDTGQVGDDEQAHPGIDHSHAGFPSQEDADIRMQRAVGDSRQADLQIPE